MIGDISGAIIVDGVVKRYRGEHEATLRSVTLRVDAGEFVVLVGPSGSGKSTLLHLIAGLDRADAGSIVVGGFDVAHRFGLNRHRRERVGLVFQLHNLLPHLTARANLEVVMLGTGRHRAERRSRATELLAMVDLADKALETPPRLSGGERQRVAVARAFANAPPVILADEPTGSLDDDTTRAVVELLRSQARSGGTVLAVTHDPRLLAAADRTLTLADGRIDAETFGPGSRAAMQGYSGHGG